MSELEEDRDSECANCHESVAVRDGSDWVHGESVCDICAQDMLDEAKERIAELEAQCAAMLEALEAVFRHHTKSGAAGRIITAALAPNAGKALLERLEKAQRLNQAKVDAELERLDIAHWKIHNAAIEKAATVLERRAYKLRYENKGPCEDEVAGELDLQAATVRELKEGAT